MIPIFRIKSLRIDNDLTKKEVSKILNVSAGTYYHYESQRNDMPIDKIIILSNFYNVSLQYLLGLTNKKDLYFKSLDYNYERIVNNLITLRRNANYTRNNLASLLYCKADTIKKYETFKRKISTEIIIKLAKIYNIPIDIIINSQI